MDVTPSEGHPIALGQGIVDRPIRESERLVISGVVAEVHVPDQRRSLPGGFQEIEVEATRREERVPRVEGHAHSGARKLLDEIHHSKRSTSMFSTQRPTPRLAASVAILR